jgi:hypothetical protein
VYAYRVEYEPISGKRVAGVISLWFADDAVEPDYLGTQVRRCDYTFECDMDGGDVIAGTGKWTGRSEKDHPDFAWYPYVAVAESPEVVYAEVKKILGDDSGPPSPPDPPRPPVNPDNPTPRPDDPQVIRPGEPVRVLAITPLQLLALVTNKTSSFEHASWVDEFNTGKGDPYPVGQSFHVRGSSEKNGYIYIFDIAPEEDKSGRDKPAPGKQESVPELRVRLLFPLKGQDNRVNAKQQFEFPGPKDKYKFVAAEPIGTHTIKTIVTERPLSITGVDRQDTQKQGGQSQGIRLPATQRQQLQGLLKMKPDEVQQLIKIKPKNLVGGFAQCETPLYVTAKPKKGKPD